MSQENAGQNPAEAAAQSDLLPSPKLGTAAMSESGDIAWVHNPREAFLAWARSEDANDGNGFSDRSIVTYGSMWGKFVQHCPVSVAAVDVGAIESFLQGLQGRVRKGYIKSGILPDPTGSRRRYLYLLSMVFAHLCDIGLRSDNPAEGLLHELDRVHRALPKPLPVALSKEDEVKLDDVVKDWPSQNWRGLRDRALLALLIGSGVKVGEVRGLRIVDLHLDADPPYLHVTGGRVERLAPLAERSVAHVRSWLKKRQAMAFVGEMLFPGDDNDWLADSTVYRIVRDAIKKADLSPVHTGPSVLRHTFATRQLRAGRTLPTVSGWLGHKMESSTAVYRLMVVDPNGVRVV